MGKQTTWMDAPLPAAVYEVRNLDEELLYVGYTASPNDRMRGHKNNSAWWNQDLSIRFHWFPTVRRARAVERLVIEIARPPFNVAHAGGAR
jgi:predicted GIY-YIG superfamily endonuclease